MLLDRASLATEEQLPIPSRAHELIPSPVRGGVGGGDTDDIVSLLVCFPIAMINTTVEKQLWEERVYCINHTSPSQSVIRGR